jgi:hypothetical protein
MIIINQPWGLGDIIFSMTAIRKQNQKVLWPVLPEYVDGCNRAYPDILFVDWKMFNMNYEIRQEYNIGNSKVIPLRFKDVPVTDCMRNKYRYWGLQWKIWKEQGQYVRDLNHEKRLFQYLGLENGESFNLISDTFQCDFRGRRIIELNNGLKNVYVKQVPGYSLFDWSLVFEQAENIHVVSSSNVYIMELLKLKAKEIKLYLRKPRETNHDNYNYILKSHNYTFE